MSLYFKSFDQERRYYKAKADPYNEALMTQDLRDVDDADRRRREVRKAEVAAEKARKEEERKAREQKKKDDENRKRIEKLEKEIARVNSQKSPYHVSRTGGWK
jgi:hypothetical protein